jgi:hypothetical protein
MPLEVRSYGSALQAAAAIVVTARTELQLQRCNGVYFENTKLRSEDVQSTRDFIQLRAKLHVMNRT